MGHKYGSIVIASCVIVAVLGGTAIASSDGSIPLPTAFDKAVFEDAYGILRMFHAGDTSATAAKLSVAEVDDRTRVVLMRTRGATHQCVGTMVMVRSWSLGHWRVESDSGNPEHCHPIGQVLPSIESESFNQTSWVAVVGVVNDPAITAVNWKIYDRNRGSGRDAYRTIPISVTNGAFDAVVHRRGPLPLDHVTVWGQPADGTTLPPDLP